MESSMAIPMKMRRIRRHSFERDGVSWAMSWSHRYRYCYCCCYHCSWLVLEELEQHAL